VEFDDELPRNKKWFEKAGLSKSFYLTIKIFANEKL